LQLNAIKKNKPLKPLFNVSSKQTLSL